MKHGLGQNRERQNENRKHSKFMVHKAFALLHPDAVRTIKLLQSQILWKSSDGRDEEFDGLTVVVLIISQLKPHYKVDMFNEISKVKKITMRQHSYDVQAFLTRLS